MPRESKFQRVLIQDLKDLFPGVVILKNDPEYKPGFPDLTLLWYNCWAVLETKASEDAPVRPNQPYYVGMLDEMSFSAFIYPENREEVLRALQQKFGV